MKVLFFIDSLHAGGKERRLTELMKALSLRSDIEFELVIMNKEIHYKEVLDLNIRIHYLIRKTKKDLSVFSGFYKICKAYRPDLVHCWESMPVVYSVPTCLLLKIKLVNGMVIDTPVNRTISNKYWLRGRLTFPFSDLIIGNSYAGLDAYMAPPNKSVCIYNGMDFERFEGLKNPCTVKKEILGEGAASFFIVGMVAAFEDRKDYKMLIKAAIGLLSKNDGLRFILVGNGVNFTKIKNSVSPEYSGKIIFLGRRSDVETIVNIFDAGILLTDTAFHGEGISNSIIEYMALSKPVIATTGGGTNEAVFNNINGYLVNPYDDKQLIEKIEMLIHNKEERLSLGKNGRQIAKEKFDLKIMQDNYMQAYNNLLNAKKK